MDTRRSLEILELESVASASELKQAYRDMVQIWHPDRFHGNTRLEQIASIKIKEINRAYNHLLAYFDPEQSKHLKTSGPSPHAKSTKYDENFGSAIHPGRQAENHSGAQNDVGSEPSGQFGSIKVYPAAKKSSRGKYFLLLVICFLLTVSGLFVYFALNLDKLRSKSVELAAEAMKMINIEIQKDIADKIKGNKDIPENTAPSQPDTQDQNQSLKPTDTEKYFEIHLHGGTIIMTESWWHKDNMIMYKQYGGFMGVEKNRVKRIVEKQATQSGLPE